MSKADKYKELFTDAFLMGPNSVRLLAEMLEKCPIDEGLRILDLGCGKGLTSLFLTKETKAQVFAVDLWVSATENYEQFKKWDVDNTVVPIHSDANDLPFANEFFDVVVSIDSFHYFANHKGFFKSKILPLVKKGGKVIIAMPGLKNEIHGCEPELILEWVNGEESEYELYHSREWWRSVLRENEDFKNVDEFDLDSFDISWQDWFDSNHPYAVRDAEYFKKGVNKYLSSIGFIIEKRRYNER